jgi:hypothetical protein
VRVAQKPIGRRHSARRASRAKITTTRRVGRAAISGVLEKRIGARLYGEHPEFGVAVGDRAKLSLLKEFLALPRAS